MAICYAWQGRISQKCFSLLLCSWLHWLLLIGCTDTANYVHQKLRERNFRAPGAFSSGLLAKLCCHSCNTVVSFMGEGVEKSFLVCMFGCTDISNLLYVNLLTHTDQGTKILLTQGRSSGNINQEEKLAIYQAQRSWNCPRHWAKNGQLFGKGNSKKETLVFANQPP